MSLPSVTLSLATETLGADDGPAEEDAAGAEEPAGAFAAFPPRLEKFHLPPAVFSSVICGCSSVIPVTRSSFDRIRGISSTPTFSDLAVTNGVEPKAGSSAIEMLSAVTEPPRIDRLRFPTLTWRPTASLAVASSFGRKLLTLITKGSTTSTTRRRATTMPIILSARFMAIFLSSDHVGGYSDQ